MLLSSPKTEFLSSHISRKAGTKNCSVRVLTRSTAADTKATNSIHLFIHFFIVIDFIVQIFFACLVFFHFLMTNLYFVIKAVPVTFFIIIITEIVHHQYLSQQMYHCLSCQ